MRFQFLWLLQFLLLGIRNEKRVYIREIYDERNHRRNQPLLPEDRICKGCDMLYLAAVCVGG